MKHAYRKSIRFMGILTIVIGMITIATTIIPNIVFAGDDNHGNNSFDGSGENNNNGNNGNNNENGNNNGNNHDNGQGNNNNSNGNNGNNNNDNNKDDEKISKTIMTTTRAKVVTTATRMITLAMIKETLVRFGLPIVQVAHRIKMDTILEKGYILMELISIQMRALNILLR